MSSVLVITKITTLEWRRRFFDRQLAKGRLQQSDMDRILLADREHHHTLERVCDLLEDAKLAYDVVRGSDNWEAKPEHRFILTVGGDGTLLAASHRVLGDQILIGVRSSGTSVGYLCAFDQESLETLISHIAADRVETFSAERLKARVQHLSDRAPTVTPPVLNDFLYSNANPAATTRYRIFVANTFEDHRSSGIWISTPVGSTAGIQAAGGKTLAHEEKIFQYRVRELIQPRGQSLHFAGGLFNPDCDRFEIENRCDRAILALDGQHGVMSLEFGDRITFQRASPLKISASHNRP